MSFFDYIRWPFGALIRLFYNWTNSYAIALLFFALVINIVLLPLGIKQQKNQIGMAKLRPRIAAIERKYAGRTDKKTLDKKQQEILALQQAAGQSPFAGCLPLLIQLPLIIILYNIVQRPLTYIAQMSSSTIEGIRNVINGVLSSNESARTLLGISEVTGKHMEINVLSFFRQLSDAGYDLSAIAPADVTSMQHLRFDLFGLDLTATPSLTNISWLIIIPILTFVASFVSMKLTRKLMGTAAQPAGGADMRVSNAIMDLIGPAMSLFISFSVPAALGVYWIYQSIFGVLKQFVLNLIMPLPKFSPEELRAIEKEEKERAKRNAAAARQAQKKRYADDDEEIDESKIPQIKSKFDDED